MKAYIPILLAMAAAIGCTDVTPEVITIQSGKTEDGPELLFGTTDDGTKATCSLQTLSSDGFKLSVFNSGSTSVKDNLTVSPKAADGYFHANPVLKWTDDLHTDTNPGAAFDFYAMWPPSHNLKKSSNNRECIMDNRGPGVDLCVATVKGRGYGNGLPVALEFEHVCAWLQDIQIKRLKEEGQTIKVIEIEFYNNNQSSGNVYSLTNGTWTFGGGLTGKRLWSGNQNLTMSPISFMSQSGQNEANIYLPNPEQYLYVDYWIGNNTRKYKKVPIELVAGKKNIVTISIDPDTDAFQVILTLQPWTQGSTTDLDMQTN